MLKNQFQAIIFDMDGVLINSESLWDESSQIFLQQRGMSFKRDQVKPLCTGKSLFDSTAIFKKFYGLSESTEKLSSERKSIVKELYPERIDYIDGCIDFINQLKARNIPIAIATSSDSELLEIVQKKLRLDLHFGEHIYSAAAVGHVSKPNPAIFLYAAEKLGISPTQCAVIEDAPNGVLAAKNAKMFSIAIETTYDAGLLQQADLIIKNFSELQKFIFDE